MFLYKSSNCLIRKEFALCKISKHRLHLNLEHFTKFSNYTIKKLNTHSKSHTHTHTGTKQQSSQKLKNDRASKKLLARQQVGAKGIQRAILSAERASPRQIQIHRQRQRERDREQALTCTDTYSRARHTPAVKTFSGSSGKRRQQRRRRRRCLSTAAAAFAQLLFLWCVIYKQVYRNNIHKYTHTY